MLEVIVWIAAAIADLVLWGIGPSHQPLRHDMSVLGDIDFRQH